MSTWADVGVEVVRSTPRFILSLVLVGCLAIFSLAAVVAAIAAWNGRGVNVFGFKVDEAKPPDVQKCADMTAAFKPVNDANSDFLESMPKQIDQILKAYQGYAPGYVSSYAEEKIKDLLARQQQVIETRNRTIDAITEACGTPKPKENRSRP